MWPLKIVKMVPVDKIDPLILCGQCKMPMSWVCIDQSIMMPSFHNVRVVWSLEGTKWLNTNLAVGVQTAVTLDIKIFSMESLGRSLLKRKNLRRSKVHHCKIYPWYTIEMERCTRHFLDHWKKWPWWIPCSCWFIWEKICIHSHRMWWRDWIPPWFQEMVETTEETTLEFWYHSWAT